jgi:hypothetical protein
MPTNSPLALSDSQITTVMGLARPLSPDQRSRFLEMLAAKLSGQLELGDGAIYRLCRDLQRELFSPPAFDRDNGASRSRRRIDDEDDRPLERHYRGERQRMWR